VLVALGVHLRSSLFGVLFSLAANLAGSVVGGGHAPGVPTSWWASHLAAEPHW
jgi:hypothetical protein